MTKIKIDESKIKTHIQSQAKTMELLLNRSQTMTTKYSKNNLNTTKEFKDNVEKIKKLLVEYAEDVETELKNISKDLDLIVEIDIKLAKEVISMNYDGSGKGFW